MSVEKSNDPPDLREAMWNVGEWVLFSFEDEWVPGCLLDLADFVEQSVSQLATRARRAVDDFKAEVGLSEADLAGYLRSPSRSLTERFRASRATKAVERFREMRRYLCYGYIVGAYTRIEQQLFFVCERLGAYANVSTPPRDIRAGDKSIGQAARYLEQEMCFIVPRDSGPWQALRLLQKLRNAIVHEGGRMGPGRRPELAAYIRLHPDHLEVDAEGYLKIHSVYLRFIPDQARTFFALLRDMNAKRLEELHTAFLDPTP